MTTTLFAADAPKTQMQAYVAYTAHDVARIVRHYPAGKTVVCCDVDDTIITPKSSTFRAAPYNQIIDRLKDNKERYPNYMDILSNWRTQRVSMLLDEAWPEVLCDLKNDYTVYALTKMDTGPFGSIDSMEQWRYDELKSLGVTFTDSGDLEREEDASCFHGIFMTGRHQKNETLQRFQKKFAHVHTLVMVDDRVGHLRDVGRFCADYGFEPVLIHYKGLERLVDRPNPKIAAFQEKYLLEHAQWLEDDEALAMLPGGRVIEDISGCHIKSIASHS